METLYPFIESYDFDEAISSHFNNYIFQKETKEFLRKNSDHIFMRFVDEYWSNTAISGEKLKIKYSIPDSILFSDIIKAYPSKTYIQFLKDFYEPTNSLQSISKKYYFDIAESISLALPIEMPKQDDFCIHCLNSNKFIIKRVLSANNTLEYKLYCKTCGIEATEFLSPLEAQNERQINGDPYGNLSNELEYVRNELIRLTCPHCNEKLDYKTFSNRLGYEIFCSNCNHRWGSIARTRINVY